MSRRDREIGLVFRIETDLDVFDARRRADRLARDVGFTRADCGLLTVVVSELGFNIVRHAVRGKIALSQVASDEHGPGVRVEASDEGPAIPDLQLAIRDRHDGAGPIDPMLLYRRPGIGSGLGAIVRLTHEFRYERTPGGNHFTVVRYRQSPSRRRSPPGW
jgi:anti-sigma regulatory factor (Ser/Thr protein kinase)